MTVQCYECGEELAEVIKPLYLQGHEHPTGILYYCVDCEAHTVYNRVTQETEEYEGWE